MNRGRHRKKKIIQTITNEDLIECLKQMTSDSLYGVSNNTIYYDFRSYFFTDYEQRKTQKIK